MFILLTSLSMLCPTDELLIIVLVLSFPFSTMYSAGWISTMTTYFAPAALGMMALVPVKDKSAPKFLCAACMVFAVNNEQMMLVLLGSYIIAFFYSLFRKHFNAYFLIMLILAVIGCVSFLTCPGIQHRQNFEINLSFPTYGMLDVFDKIEIGLTTTLHWIFYENQLFIILICIAFAIMIFERYKNVFFRIIACIPVIAVLFSGVFETIFPRLFAVFSKLTEDIPYYGLINAENRGGFKSFIQFSAMGILVLLICIEIYLLAYSVKDLVVSYSLLGLGAASRVALGFSPTIYQSGKRTFCIMSFCFIAAAVYTISNHHCLENSVLFNENTKVVCYAMIAGLMADLFLLVLTTFR